MSPTTKAHLTEALWKVIPLIFAVGAAWGFTRAELATKADAADLQELRWQQQSTAAKVDSLGARLTALICWKNPNPACR